MILVFRLLFLFLAVYGSLKTLARIGYFSERSQSSGQTGCRNAFRLPCLLQGSLKSI